MLYRVIDDNGTKKREALVGVGYGMPLGAVVELADNIQLPDGYLLCDGSTFDATKYPALYAYLGGNTLPVYTSHSSGWTETIDLLTSTKFPGLPQAKQGSLAAAFEVPYDGVIGFRSTAYSAAGFTSAFHIYRNGTDIVPVQAATFTFTQGYNNTLAGEATVRRGDKVFVNDNRISNFWYSYSNKFKAIKATPAGSGDISDVGALIRKANPDWIVLNASVTSGYEIPGLLDAINGGAIGFELLFAPYSETPTAYVTEKCIKVAGLTSQAFRLDANAAYGMNTTSIDWTTGILSGNYVSIYAWRPIYGVIA